MSVDPEHIAYHEAGHAVMQWLVGWDADLRFMQMRRVPDGATEGGTNAKTPVCKSLSSLRKRLVFLCAGSSAASKKLGHETKDFDTDYDDVCKALAQHFVKISKFPELGPPEAKQAFEEAICKTNELFEVPEIWMCIQAVAELLLSAKPAADGLCVVQAADIFSTCERICGPQFRGNHQSAAWLSGA
jgi:hypothetical protein